MSAGRPTRSSGMAAAICLRASSGIAVVMSVSISPGATTFASTFRLASSLATLFVRPMSPALLAA
jgi:hypothetical protein